MKKPNFFIIGAPKCGTTSLAKWLGRHPNIYLSNIKEPHYFYTDGNSKFITTHNWDEYIRLFKDVSPMHHAVGEASVFYLFSKEAVKNILNLFPEAKFIVLLRNPVEMAASLHWQEIYSENEQIIEFQKAWEVQPLRAQGKMITPKCKEPRHLVYGDVCKLGEQMQRLITLVNRERIKIIFLEDIISDPQKAYADVLRFLDVNHEFTTDFKPENIAKSVRSKTLNKLLKLGGSFKSKIGIRKRTGIFAPILKLNTVRNTKPAVPNDFKAKLKCYFREDIRRLELITDRNLSHWTS